MTANLRRLIGIWFVGMIVGTGLIAVTSPLFIRSYLPLQADPTRGVWTLPAGGLYRWRSEGYATTRIGPLGMPGKVEIPSRRPGTIRVALWGDSQGEGACVRDPDKLFAQTEMLSQGRLEVFPFARSGEDAADWLTQMPLIESAVDVDLHVLLIVDLGDLFGATEAPLPPPAASDVAAGNASIAAILPAFVIQGARHLLTEPDQTTRRSLRFTIGPAHPQISFRDNEFIEQDQTGATDQTKVFQTNPPALSDPSANSIDQWRTVMRAIRQASSLPILIVHAPVSPQIIDGTVVEAIDQGTDLNSVFSAARESGLLVATTHRELSEAASQGRWPHGFQNGHIGSGHLNALGNRLVSSVIVQTVLDVTARRYGALPEDSRLENSAEE